MLNKNTYKHVWYKNVPHFHRSNHHKSLFSEERKEREWYWVDYI